MAAVCICRGARDRRDLTGPFPAGLVSCVAGDVERVRRSWREVHEEDGLLAASGPLIARFAIHDGPAGEWSAAVLADVVGLLELDAGLVRTVVLHHAATGAREQGARDEKACGGFADPH